MKTADFPVIKELHKIVKEKMKFYNKMMGEKKPKTVLDCQAAKDANYQKASDVTYTDLNHFIDNCRNRKDKESFDTAIRILEAIKEQVLGKTNDLKTRK